MAHFNDNYIERHVDAEIRYMLTLFGAVSIVGPKWCGKTWTALNNSHSSYFLMDPSDNYQKRYLASLDMDIALDGEKPHLIDEWQELPRIRDAIRYKIDMSGKKGLFVLTGSSTPSRKSFIHPGTGRICDVRMETMTLSERGISDNKVSLKMLFDKTVFATRTKELNLRQVVDITLHGGWPGTINNSTSSAMKICSKYLDDFITKDLPRSNEMYDGGDMRRLICSLARNESTLASKRTLINDMRENDDDEPIATVTLNRYLSFLERSFLVEWQPAFNPNMRSSARVGKSPKRHLVDPALVAAAIGKGPEAYINDLNAFGLLFESLCEHDLRIYARTMDGTLRHYRDGDGTEVDAIVELSDGRWGAFEIKLGAEKIDEGAESLKAFYQKIERCEKGRLPEFLCVICGLSGGAYRREDGVYVVPITSLCP